MMALDHSHEHSIKFLKEDSGANWDSMVNEKKRKRLSSRNLKFLGPWISFRMRVSLHLKPRTVWSIPNPQLVHRKNFSITWKLFAILSIRAQFSICSNSQVQSSSIWTRRGYGFDVVKCLWEVRTLAMYMYMHILRENQNRNN